MATKAHNDALLLAGGAAAAYAGYKFLLAPFLAKQAAGATGYPAIPQPYPATYTPTPSPYVSTPTIVGPSPYAPGGVQGSIVDPRTRPGGDVGQAMWRKNWTEAQARTRLEQLKAAYAGGAANLARLQGRLPDLNALAAARTKASQLDQAAANADGLAAAATQAGDLLGAAKFQGMAAAYRADATEVKNRISTAATTPDPAVLAEIETWKTAMAGHANDYFILTGLRIPGS